MMEKRLLPLIIIASLLTTTGVAQQSMLYNHYYMNPFLYNPSYIAPSGYSELNLNHRRQWVGIDGAPTTSTLNVQLPLNYKSGLALTAIQDEAGVLKTTTGLISFSYAIHFGKKVTDINKVTFGLSAGVTSSRIDPDQADDLNDPVIGNNTTSMDGQFGIHYRYNKFRLGFAIPRIFETQVVAEDNFTKPGIAQLDNTITSISYEFGLSDRFAFEPMVTYRTYQNLDPHYEAMGTFKIDDIAWVGGAYRQNYGAFAYFGFNVKQKLRIAYSYEFATTQTDKMGNGSHELQISYRIGKKQHARPQKTSTVATPQPQETTPETTPENPTTVTPAETQVTPPVVTPQVVTPAEKPTSVTPTPTNTTVQPKETPAEVKPPTVTNLKGEGLAPGHYVVVGIFNSSENALNYMRTLRKAGYPANVAYDGTKKRYVVHMEQPGDNIEEARKLRDKYRQMSRYSFRDTWILSID